MVIRPRPTGVPFGRYLIRRKLGRGGMGEVFLADQLGPLGPVRPVALKRMLPNLAADRETARLFLEEMAIAAQLNHPNIATTYDFGEVDGDYFFAMEYVEGLSLNRIIASIGPIPPPVALEIAKQVADALAYAHAKRLEGRAPVVHQDVSPHNVMISKEGAVKLLDFGIARAEAAVLGGSLRAKAAYAAPEQLRGAAPDRRFDLWSLGVVLYESLSGQRPFEGQDLMEILRAAETRAYPKVSSLRPEVEPFEELITRALEPDPEKRWLGAEAFRTSCLRLGERFGLAKAADLGLLVERAGGTERDDIAEVSGTGVAALDAEAMAALHAVEANRAEEVTATKPTRSRAPWSLVLALVLLSFVIAGVASLFRREPEPAITSEPPMVAAPMAEPAQPPETPPAIVESAAPADAGVAAVRALKKKPKRAKPPPRPSAPIVAEGFGKLSVRTDPTWARLLLDGQPIGRTILYGRPFDPGTHRLQMVPGDDGFAPLDTTVTIKPGVTTNVFANFRTREIKVVER